MFARVHIFPLVVVLVDEVVTAHTHIHHTINVITAVTVQQELDLAKVVVNLAEMMVVPLVAPVVANRPTGMAVLLVVQVILHPPVVVVVVNVASVLLPVIKTAVAQGLVETVVQVLDMLLKLLNPAAHRRVSVDQQLLVVMVVMVVSVVFGDLMVRLAIPLLAQLLVVTLVERSDLLEVLGP
jgi:hypothetical protein